MHYRGVNAGSCASSDASFGAGCPAACGRALCAAWKKQNEHCENEKLFHD
jgi:hypothetical protein